MSTELADIGVSGESGQWQICIGHSVVTSVHPTKEIAYRHYIKELMDAVESARSTLGKPTIY